MAAPDYGRYYWGVKTTEGEIYIHADEVKVTEGVLTFMQRKDDGLFATLMVAAGSWSVIYAASVMDGSAIAVEHWPVEMAG